MSLCAVALAAAVAGCGGDGGTSTVTAKSGQSGTSRAEQTTATEPIAARRARRLRAALASIARHVDVPVVLPSNLPEGASLSSDPTINNTSSQLIMDLGLPSYLVIEYGVATLSTCRSVQRVMVGDAPGLMSTSRVSPDGSAEPIPYRTVVWPATPELPEGRYGISGTFSAAKILTFARAMKGTTSFAPRDAESHCFESIEAAVEYIAKRVDVPVVVPANLPTGTKVAGASAGPGYGQLALRLPGPRNLSIQYGKAGFDGCGPTNPRAVRVGTNPAVVNSPEHPGKGPTYRTLVWPATLKDLEGRYGLSGTFSVEQLISFAESMERARAGSPRGPKTNC